MLASDAMRTWPLFFVASLGCGSSDATEARAHAGSAGGSNSGGASASGGAAGTGGVTTGTGGVGVGGVAGAGGTPSEGGKAGSGGAPSPCGPCPVGYVCGSANGLPVCRAPSGVPLFTTVIVIVMENTSLATLAAAIKSGGAPNLGAMASAFAAGSDHHGVAHPSLPNYLALTSGDTQGVTCDCHAAPGQGACNVLSCNKVLGSCSCDSPAPSVADQLEAAGLSWMAYAEGMGAPCNLTDAGSYAVRHVPFLYYDGIQKNAARCAAHVVDLSAFDLGAPARFNFIAPNLVSDMHDPFPAGPQNIANGDAWLGPRVKAVLASATYAAGGLFVVVWDEDDASGGLTGADDPIAMYVMSPFAKSGGFLSAVKTDHYSLLATIEDGLALPRMGKAGQSRPGVADTLADYFPPM